MKKLRRLAALLLALTMVFSAFPTVSAASAAFPEALTVIEDEAFAGSDLFEGLVQVPFGVIRVGENAFGSNVYALEIPMTVETLDDQTASEMAYVRFSGFDLPSPLPENFNTRYVFGDNDNLMMWSPFIGATYVNRMDLQQYEGFYYRIDYNTNRYTLLCAIDNTAVPENVTIPESIFGRSVEALSPNAFFGCEHVTSITLMGTPEEQAGCFDGAPSAAINRHVDPEISLHLADGFEADWFCDIPLQLKNTSYEGTGSVSCTLAFLNDSDQVVLEQENIASLSIPSAFGTTEQTISLDGQVWARAWQAGGRKLRITLNPVQDVPLSESHSAAAIELPSTPGCPIMLLEYSQTAQPNSEYVVKITCLNPDKLTEYRPVELCDANGNVLASYYIGPYHPTGELKTTVGQDAPSYIVRYPGANGATYTHAINPTISALTGVSGADSTGVTLSAGQTVTVECTYAGAMPQITCTSGNTYVAMAQLSGSTLTITAVANGSTSITVTDGTASFVIPVTVQAPMITGIYHNGVLLNENANLTFNLGETIVLNCTYSGSLPTITCTTYDGGSFVKAQVDGANIILTGVGKGSTYLDIYDGVHSHMFQVTVDAGVITGFLYNGSVLDSGTTITIDAGTTITLECTYTGPLPRITVSDYDESVVNVQVDGASIIITGVGRGNASLAIRDGVGLHYRSVQVETGNITGIYNPDGTDANKPLYLGAGETHTIECTYTGIMPAITCTSSDESVVTAQVNGTTITITAVGGGSANLTIGDKGPYGYMIPVTVTSGEITGISQVDYLLVTAGETAKLAFTYTGTPMVTCTSYNTGIATAEREGDFILVHGVSAGITQIRIEDGSGSFYYVEARVIRNPGEPVKPDSYPINGGSTATVNVGRTCVLYTAYSQYNVPLPENVTFTSSDESIARIMGQLYGQVYVLGVSAGTAQITVSDGEVSSSVNVNVVDNGTAPLPVLYLDLSNAGQTLGADGSFTLTVRSRNSSLPTNMIYVQWEFLASDGTVVHTRRENYGINNNTVTDQAIILEEELPLELLYQKGARSVRAALAPDYRYSECLVESPEQYLTFRIVDPAAAGTPVFFVESEVVAPKGTEAVLTVQCLNPASLGGNTCYVYAPGYNGSAYPRIGALTQANPKLQFRVTSNCNVSFVVHDWLNGRHNLYSSVYFVDYSDFELENRTLAVGESVEHGYNKYDTWTIEDESVATFNDRYITGVAPGVTTITIHYGPEVRTAQVRVYDPASSQTAEMTFAQEQPVWPWVRPDSYYTWKINVQADQPADALAYQATVNTTIVFKDAAGNVAETLRYVSGTRFDQSNAGEMEVILNESMLNRLASSGVVKAEVQIEAISGQFTFDLNNRTVEIAMDDLNNYTDYPMFHVINNNPSDLKMGDTASFTLCGNPAVNREYSIVIEYLGLAAFPNPPQTLNTTYNPARDGQKEITFTVPSDCLTGRTGLEVSIDYLDPANANQKTDIYFEWLYIAQ